MTQYMIIGMGVAGISAADAIRSLDNSGSITFIGDDPHGYYSKPGLAYYLTHEVDQAQLYPFGPQDLKKHNARFLHGTVIKILPGEKQVELSDGRRLSYDKLLLAVGAKTIRLNIPGAVLEGVLKLDHLEDANQIVSIGKRGKTAVVIGGGITALELAEGLASRNVKVNMMIRTPHYWSNVLDDVESEIIERRLKKEGIKLFPNTEVVEILEKHGKAGGVRLGDGTIIKCDLVVYAIGIKPRLTLARSAGINCERGILVDEYLKTNLEGIYSAGDAAQVFDPLSGRSVLDSLWAPAREQGWTAGINMAGGKTIYHKPVAVNVTRLAGLTTAIIGMVGSGRDGEPYHIARGDSETWRDVPDAIIAQNGFDVNHMRLMVSKQKIVGALLMGDQKLSRALQVIIRDGIDISPIREQLLVENAPIADIMAKFWTKVHNSQNNN